MKLVHIGALAAVGLTAATLAGVFEPSGANSAPAADSLAGAITVVGQGSNTAVPDRACFSFGTVSQADTAGAALAASSKAVERIVDALRKTGIAKADIQTSEVSLSPRMNDKGNDIVGYTASNTVSVTVRRLADAGEVVDAAVGAGANQVYGPNLLVSDQDAAYRSALKGAVADAREKAAALASAAGRTLGEITAISEGGATAVPLPEGATRDTSVPIEPGTQKIEATVSVTFAFN